MAVRFRAIAATGVPQMAGIGLCLHARFHSKRSKQFILPCADVSTFFFSTVSCFMLPYALRWLSLAAAGVPQVARIGLFLHTPFPPNEVFRALPQRQELLRGMLGADQVGRWGVGYLQ